MGRSPCCDKSGLKKGPWTQEEDLKLTQYIQIHGPGNWRTLPKNAGLQRCGKSCRLRWTNYLRPDIKRGRFSFEEEETIIQLHSVLGNKWSAIATRLPGRTDNEIKNYWNTNIRKKLLRNGIDPVTHTPRLDLSHLSSILNSAQFNISNLLSLQNLVNPEVFRLISYLATASSNQINQELFLNNHINTINLNSHQQTEICANHEPQYYSKQYVNHNDQIIQEHLNNSEILPTYFPQFMAQSSENLTSQNFNFDFDSMLSVPKSSPRHANSSSTLINSSSSEDERGSQCSNVFKFEIPESLEFDDFM